MSVTHEQLRTWLRAILTKTGDTPSNLARRAGLATTTLTRFLNSDDAPMLSTRSIAKIADVTGAAPIGLPTTQGQYQTEAIPLAPPQESEEARQLSSDASELSVSTKAAINALVDGRPAARPWVLHTRALELAGVLPEDIVIVDLNVTAHASDLVCAQVYEWQRGRALTVFRFYEPPYLIAAAIDPQLRRPLVVDNDRVVIKGTVTALLRLPLPAPEAADKAPITRSA